ncbi:MAG: bifunctional nuclease family protein [Candidatus Obscuribacterales bacterium]
MFVIGLGVDPRDDQPILVLSDAAGKRALPIWIGAPEASAISSALRKQDFGRPMTHDLLFNTIQELDYTVKGIEIVRETNNIFFATIKLVSRKRGKEVIREIDARPSDAIAIAIRANAPLHVASEVFESRSVPLEREGDEDIELVAEEKEDDQEFKRFLSEVKASDFKLE